MLTYHVFVDLLAACVYVMFMYAIWPLRLPRFLGAIACFVLVYHLGVAYGYQP